MTQDDFEQVVLAAQAVGFRRCLTPMSKNDFTACKEADDRLEELRRRLVDTAMRHGQAWVGVDEAAIADSTVFMRQHWDDDSKVVVTQVIPLRAVMKPPKM